MTLFVSLKPQSVYNFYALLLYLMNKLHEKKSTWRLNGTTTPVKGPFRTMDAYMRFQKLSIVDFFVPVIRKINFCLV